MSIMEIDTLLSQCLDNNQTSETIPPTPVHGESSKQLQPNLTNSSQTANAQMPTEKLIPICNAASNTKKSADLPCILPHEDSPEIELADELANWAASAFESSKLESNMP